MNYSTDVKRTALEKMLRSGGKKLSEISKEMDIPKDTLYFWLRKAKDGSMDRKKRTSDLQQKQAKILEARNYRDEDLGRWLRKNGLHESQLIAWTKEIDSHLAKTDGHSGRESEQRKRIKELERDLFRKDKALAEMAALAVLKKKMTAFYDQEASPK